MEQEEKLCDELETVRDFTYLGDWVSAGGGCEAAVSAGGGCEAAVSAGGGCECWWRM